MNNMALYRLNIIFLMLFFYVLPLTVNAGAKVGDNFGDWIYECEALVQSKTTCSLTQTIVSKSENRRIMKFS